MVEDPVGGARKQAPFRVLDALLVVTGINQAEVREAFLCLVVLPVLPPFFVLLRILLNGLVYILKLRATILGLLCRFVERHPDLLSGVSVDISL